MLLSVPVGCIVTLIVDFVLCVLSVVVRPAMLASYSNKRNSSMYSRRVRRLNEEKLVIVNWCISSGARPSGLNNNNNNNNNEFLYRMKTSTS